MTNKLHSIFLIGISSFFVAVAVVMVVILVLKEEISRKVRK